MDDRRNPVTEELIKVIKTLLKLVVILVLALLFLPLLFYKSENLITFFSTGSTEKKSTVPKQSIVTPDAGSTTASLLWKAPDIDTISDNNQKQQIAYGKELIAHTAKYLGPQGSVMKISNGMNCQNCHLEAGTKPWGNNYGSVASLYPKFRARSGQIENIYKRVNDCFERSLNGKSLDTLGNEMQAIKAYIEFLGSHVEKGKKAEGSGFKELAFLDRAADPEKGKVAYEVKCKSCHTANGEGLLLADGSEYTYPPLWGNHSFNDGAGLYRITNFARYIKFNMPQGVTYENPQLTDEEAWDLAAFINSQKRPHKNVPADWPDKSKKPIDHPFGPYADTYSEKQHKLGPFKPIAEKQKERDAETKLKASSSIKK